jgi:hypothetical protein
MVASTKGSAPQGGSFHRFLVDGDGLALDLRRQLDHGIPLCDPLGLDAGAVPGS